MVLRLLNDDTERIEELEEQVADLQTTTTALNGRVKQLQNALDDAELRAEVNKLRADVLSDQHLRKDYEPFTSLRDEYRDPSGSVHTLDKTYVAWKATENAIAKLFVPKGATVVFPETIAVQPSATSYSKMVRVDNANAHKFRTDVAVVAELEEADGTYYTGYKDESRHANYFTYEIGDVVRPESGLDEDTNVRCSAGIHFFPQQDMAVEWLEA